jgi:hypothetical protein
MERSERSQLFLNALKEKLSQAFPDRATTIVHEIEAAVLGLRQLNQSRVVDEPSKHHLELTPLILASYRVMSTVMPDRDATLSLIRLTLAEPLQGQMQAYLTRRLSILPDVPAKAFEAAATNFKPRGEQLFGEAFRYEQEVQMPEQSFGLFRDYPTL